MSTLAESLRRLYQSGKVDKRKISSMELEGKITENEMEYILNRNNA